MKKKITEKIVVLKALAGNKEAFGYIFDKYSKKIYRFIFFKVGRHELAEDLASQVFLQVWEHILNKYKIKNLQAFIYQVARNIVVDYYRNKEKEELPLIYEEAGQQLPRAEVDGGEVLGQQFDNESLLKIINQLKGIYREIIVLKYIEDLSLSEIAEIMEKSKVNVRVLLHRALKEIKKLLE